MTRALLAVVTLVGAVAAAGAHPHDFFHGHKHHKLAVSVSGFLSFGSGCGFGGFPVVPFYDFPSRYSVIQIAPPPVFVRPPIFVEPPIFDPFPPAVGGFRPAAPVPPLDPPPVDPALANRPGPPPPVLKDALDQKAEALRLIRDGNEMFANGNYQAATRNYEQAVAVAPQEPMGYFHLAQAHVALGKYAEAAVAIQRGMKLHLTWPQSTFRPRALYRDRPGEYLNHLAKLADAIAKNLNDDSLLFLLGYQLWFDGQKDEALVLFRRAAGLAADTALLDRFLKAPVAPGVPVAKP